MPHTPSDLTSSGRESLQPVDPLFIDRWSSRAFSGEAIPEADLYSCFEAARWAPSAFNAQPWRFVYAHRGGEGWDTLLGLLVPKNQLWAKNASALIFVLSKKDFETGGQTYPIGSHSFDTGAAWGSFAHQARLLGYSTRGMAGFDHAAAPGILGVPDNFKVEACIAIGFRSGLEDLDPSFHDQEKPSPRRPLESFVFKGRFDPSGE